MYTKNKVVSSDIEFAWSIDQHVQEAIALEFAFEFLRL